MSERQKCQRTRNDSPSLLEKYSGHGFFSEQIENYLCNKGYTYKIVHPSERITSVAISGNTIVIGTDKGTVRIWDHVLKNCLHEFKDQLNEVSVAIRDDAIVSGSLDGTLMVWTRQQSGEWIVCKKIKNKCAITSVDINHTNNNSHIIVYGSWDNYVRVMILNPYRLFRYKDTGWTSSVAICRNTVVYGLLDGTVKVVLNYRRTNNYKRKASSLKSVTSVASTLNNFVTATEDGTVKVWDITSGNCVHVLESDSSSKVNAVDMIDNIIVSGSDNGVVQVWEDGKCIKHRKYKGSVNAVAISDNTIVIGTNEGTVRVWNWESNVNDTTTEDYEQYINALQNSEAETNSDNLFCRKCGMLIGNDTSIKSESLAFYSKKKKEDVEGLNTDFNIIKSKR